ncbi:CapA family protein [Numidum massiliense]|uniref:CapA family protein n=1 Tax=Numidum massiliense TaxID=1522315 RepID=UPI0006D56D17|nr:CapA family protein [Numidum massiliense]
MSKQLTFQQRVLKMAKRHKQRALPHTMLAIGISVVLIVALMVFNKPQAARVEASDRPVFTATMVGDMMFGRHVEEVTKRYGYESLFQFVKPMFDASDYISGNFEQAVTLAENPTAEKGYQKWDKNIHLRTDPEAVEVLKRMNFSVLNLANNHVLDYGRRGLQDTIETMNRFTMDYVGAGMNLEEAQQAVYQTINGITVASVGITDSYMGGQSVREKRPGVLPLKPEYYLPAIQEAKKNADFVIVNVHWGQEYDGAAHPRQRDSAKAMADAGADLIVGHHPHVLSSVEVYNDTVIFYSLGNFIFDQGWSRTKDSALLQYKLYGDGKARFEVMPLRINEATPAPAEGWYAQKRIFRQLTKDTPVKDDWKVEDGKLVYTVDHSDILKGASKLEK